MPLRAAFASSPPVPGVAARLFHLAYAKRLFPPFHDVSAHQRTLARAAQAAPTRLLHTQRPPMASATSASSAKAGQLVDSVLTYWFGTSVFPDRYKSMKSMSSKWYAGGEAVDNEIRQQFGGDVELALSGAYDDALAVHSDLGVKGALTLVVLTDQFTRNMFRGTARAYAGDPKALAASLAVLDNPDVLQPLPFAVRPSFILPLMHDETVASHDRCIAAIKGWIDALAAEINTMQKSGDSDKDKEETKQKLARAAECMAGLNLNLNFAHKHRSIIDEFGRYPYRNAALGRESTEAELVYLKDGPRFGQ